MLQRGRPISQPLPVLVDHHVPDVILSQIIVIDDHHIADHQPAAVDAERLTLVAVDIGLRKAANWMGNEALLFFFQFQVEAVDEVAFVNAPKFDFAHEKSFLYSKIPNHLLFSAKFSIAFFFLLSTDALLFFPAVA